MNSKPSNIKPLLPLFGICLFIVLYIVAALLYPGGSDIDKSSIGFDWLHNYWCELMATRAINDEINTARPIAIIAMGVLCISLAIFWYYASKLFWPGSYGRRIVQSTGILSMVVVVFLSTDGHDMVINFSGILGMIALTGTLIGLYKIKAWLLLALGAVCVVLVVVNNYVYYATEFSRTLPVIQKITFALFLLWFSLVNILLYRREKKFAPLP